jgi:hypothetical protein
VTRRSKSVSVTSVSVTLLAAARPFLDPAALRSWSAFLIGLAENDLLLG